MKPITVGRVTGGQYRPDHAQELCHGFPVGLPIMTVDGERPVECLSAGDMVVTRNGGLTRLEAIHASTHTTRAIRLSAWSFGFAGPTRDIVLPADQPVLVREGWALALFGQIQAMTIAAQLVDGDGIADIGPRRLVLFRLSFDRPRVIQAAGLELGASHAASLPRRAVA